MPTLVALIGGSHHDSRFKRGIGGTLPPEVDARTSNVPFVGMLFGDQSQDGGVGGAFKKLGSELKGYNMALGASIAVAMAMRRVKRLR